MKGLVSAALMLLSGGAVQDDAFDRTLAALRSGSAAASTDDVGPMRRAAAELRAVGARPLDGGDDLATRWRRPDQRRSPPPFRDRIIGPGYRSVTVSGNGVWRAEQAFLAGQRARVGIVATHAGSFSLKIVDDDHEMVCHASHPNEQCDWVPAYTSRYSIEVHNPGPKPEEFLVVIQ